jgi:hypothetical protein
MSTSSESRAPVFVDDSGRRRGIVRAIGWLLATATAVAVALSLVALTVSPSVASSARRARTPDAGLRVESSAPHQP